MQIRVHIHVWRIHRVLLKSTDTHMCMQVCIYTYICVIHTCIHVYAASTVRFYNAWYAWQLSAASQKIYTYVYLCVSHTCMHIYVCIHTCAHICVTVDFNTSHWSQLSHWKVTCVYVCHTYSHVCHACLHVFMCVMIIDKQACLYVFICVMIIYKHTYIPLYVQYIHTYVYTQT